MKKNSGILSCSLVVALAVTLLFACSTGSGGSDDKPDTFAITVLQNGATDGDGVTANIAKAEKDAIITLTASLGTGRRVALSADGVAITPSTISTDEGTATFTMPGNAVVITAIFSDIPPTLYPITITPTGANGNEKVIASVTEATEGTAITLTAILDVGRRVALTADGVTITPATISANGDTASFSMPGNAVVVTATFSDIPPTLYAITVTPNGAETGESVTASVTEAKEGTSVTLTASLGNGRRVTLNADGVVITPATISTDDGTATFTMPGNAAVVTATFYSVYLITINPIGATGSEAVTASVTEAAAGTTITLTAALGVGRCVALSADSATITSVTISTNGDTATFTMPGNAVEVTATFNDILYPITITQGDAIGSDALTASVSEAVEGTTITLTATLGIGRRVMLSATGVTITQATISTSGDMATFTMPYSGVTVSATFSDISAGDIQTHVVEGESFNTHYIPSGGTFIMGEHVQTTTQEVTLTNNFWMGEIEVTQGLWEAVWGTSWPGEAEGEVPSNTYGIGTNKPAYTVNWYETVVFCNLLTEADSSIEDSEQVYYSDEALSIAYTKADATSGSVVHVDWTKKGYRLPTEAEWEYAARYIDGTTWINGDHSSGDTDYACYIPGSGPKSGSPLAPDTRISEYAWWSGNNSGIAGDSTYGTKIVGQKNCNGLGLCDMSGNVWEWCHDVYTSYSGGTVSDPKGPESGINRVIRGGSWFYAGDYLRCAFRISASALSRGVHGFGFRLCRTAD